MADERRITIGNGRFVMGRRLGGGAFGEVYTCTATTRPPDGGPLEEFAVKLEPTKTSHQPHLFAEAKVYTSLQRPNVTVGIPKVRWFGVEGDFNVLVMELVGPSLTELLEFCHGRFDSKTVMMLAHQAISRLQFVHVLGYLHRDLKPDNLAMGMGKRSHHLYLIDFGLAKKYMDKSTQHIPFRDGKSLTGTARYVSIATHKGMQQARRDDMESLGHVLIFLAKGSVPWQAVRSNNKNEKYEKIMAMKIATPPTVLCARLPNAFHKFLSYSRNLKFEEEPNYEYCRQLFEGDMADRGYEFDYQYSWVVPSGDGSNLSSASKDKDGGESSANAQSGHSTLKGTRTASRSFSGSGARGRRGKGHMPRKAMMPRSPAGAGRSPSPGGEGAAADGADPMDWLAPGAAVGAAGDDPADEDA